MLATFKFAAGAWDVFSSLSERDAELILSYAELTERLEGKYLITVMLIEQVLNSWERRQNG